jgi:imidazolonepropionase
VSTVRATREAAEDDLVTSALPRLDRLLAEGVTTIEVKSGYGLEREAEFRMLHAARRLGTERPVRVATSYLGAHAWPPDRERAAYLDEVCATIPALAREGLADAVDSFCESIAFSPAETGRVFEAARAAGLPVKLHADQLSDLGGAALAARFGALSADHLEHTSEDGAAAMAVSGTVAVLLPGAYYFIRETKLPPVEAFRRHGVPLAVATDCNPGSSPLTSLLLAMNMAATLFRLTVEEILAGVTRNAAQALGLSRRDRHAGSRKVLRPRDLRRRAPGGARLSDGLQSAPRPRLPWRARRGSSSRISPASGAAGRRLTRFRAVAR